MSKHTPGPWFINDQYAETEIRGPQDSGILIAVMSPWGVAAETPSPQRANARLIESAPDLIGAIEHLFDCLPIGDNGARMFPTSPRHAADLNAALDRGRAAIAKAKP